MRSLLRSFIPSLRLRFSCIILTLATALAAKYPKWGSFGGRESVRQFCRIPSRKISISGPVAIARSSVSHRNAYRETRAIRNPCFVNERLPATSPEGRTLPSTLHSRNTKLLGIKAYDGHGWRRTTSHVNERTREICQSDRVRGRGNR